MERWWGRKKGGAWMEREGWCKWGGVWSKGSNWRSDERRKRRLQKKFGGVGRRWRWDGRCPWSEDVPGHGRRWDGGSENKLGG